MPISALAETGFAAFVALLVILDPARRSGDVRRLDPLHTRVQAAAFRLAGGGDTAQQLMIIGALVAALAVVLLSLLRAEILIRLLKVTGCTVAARLIAINLAALAVQFIIDGMHDVLLLWRVSP